MPPLGTKGKGKIKDSRQSRSRNTTPSSAISAPTSAAAGQTAYLDISIERIVIPTTLLYEDLLERHSSNGGIPEPKHLELLLADLKLLSDLASTRETACDAGMRELSDRRKIRAAEEQEMEQASRKAEDKANLKRSAEDEDADRSAKGKLKKRKDHSAREERPLAHGAHGVARQDGVDTTPKGRQSSPARGKRSTVSGSSSSLSPPSQAASPTVVNPKSAASARSSPAPSSSSDDSHQPPPAASVPQYQTFGPNPLTFDDPTVYHVRDVESGMTDEEKCAIYSVASFPHSDLADLIAGVPPDKDFSNAKPTNQVNANTFAAYLEPYFRSLTEEDMAFLKERGDRVTPFLMPRRGTKSYQQLWAEEDGLSVSDSHYSKEKLPANQPRGNLESMDDEVAETDKISGGPLLNRLLSAMRFENRPEEKEKVNGVVNGDVTMTNGLANGDSGLHPILGSITHEPGDLGASKSDEQPPATYFAESTSAGWKAPIAKQDFSGLEERLKAELRYIGFIGPEEEPDYDSHQDDDVAQRLRVLQNDLRKVMIQNGARKARILQIAQEHMAYQEFATIRDDLDTQVVQAFSKRNRSLGKGKKNTKRPGGAGGGSHFPSSGPNGVGAAGMNGTSVGGAGGAGVAKPGIGDVAKTVMDRRKRWKETIEPVFSSDVTRVREHGQTIFSPQEMAPLVLAEKERLDEEAE